MSSQPKFLSEQQVAERQGRRPALSHAEFIARSDAAIAECNEMSAQIHAGGRIFPHTKSNDPILGANKITYAHFIKTVWVLSNTNLHIKDFEAEFGAELTRMFHPVRIKNGSGA